jgi:two-component sensor histidine kinase/CHASE3 domain sensor protein
LLAAESSQRGFAITTNEIYLAPYENASSVVRSELIQLIGRLQNDAQKRRMMARLSEVVDQKIREIDAVIALVKAGATKEAAAVLMSNQGKALMDEAQIFLSAIILEADDALVSGLRDQTDNTAGLRTGSLIASVLILAFVGWVVLTLLRYSREIAVARDELALANSGLEARVAQRTADLAEARDRAEVLLTEVNHRVANSLSFVGALINLQRQAVTDPVAKGALDETRSRILAVAQIHKHLYSSGDVTSVQLDTYMKALLEQIEQTMAAEGHGAVISHRIEPLRVPTNTSINLGIVITEWVTNAFKYAYGGDRGEVRVRAGQKGDQLVLAVEDDGVGMSASKSPRGTGVGSKIVATIARSLKAEVSYRDLEPGTEASLVMPLVPSQA